MGKEEEKTVNICKQPTSVQCQEYVKNVPNAPDTLPCNNSSLKVLTPFYI